jgi:hypothetical protein
MRRPHTWLWVAGAITSFAVLADGLTAFQDRGTAGPEPWQTSWEKFVESHNACIKAPSCDRKRYLDKEVRWEGSVGSIDLGKTPPIITMTMPGPTLTDRNGEGIDMKRDLFVFGLHPTPADVVGWKDIAKGDRVRFQAKTSGGLTGSVVGFSAIPGTKMLMVNVDGGTLLEKVGGK